MADDTPIVPVVQHPADILIRARCLGAAALVVFADGSERLLDLADSLADGTEDALTPLERRALDGGALEPAERVRLSWQTVSAAVLLWGINRLDERPAHDRAPDAQVVIDTLLERPELSGEDRLRPMTELREYSRTVRVWAWGTRDEQMVRATGSTTLQQPVPENSAATPILTGSQAQAEHDLQVDGAALREVGDERLEELIAINHERLRASRWMLGEASWDAVAMKT